MADSKQDPQKKDSSATATTQLPVVTAEQATSPELPQEFLAKRKQARRKRYIKFACGAVALCVVIGVIVAVVLKSGSDDAQQLSGTSTYTEQISVGDLDLVVEGSGELAASSTTSVVPSVSGTVTKIYVQEGDSVKKGDTLFTMSSEDVEDAVSDAADAKKTASVSLSSARSNYKSALSTYKKAKKAAKKSKKSSAGSSADNSAATTLASSSSTDSVSSAKTALNEAKSTLAQAKEAYSQALDDYNDALEQKKALKVTAVLAGTITEINISKGDTVSSSGSSGGSTSSSASANGSGSSSSSDSAAMVISDYSKMSVTTSVSEYNINNLKKGQDASVTVSSLDITVDATVTAIAKTASSSSSSGSSGSSTAYYDVTLTIDDPSSKMIEGMSVSTEIVYASYKDSLLVPSGAVSEDEDGNSYVTVQADDGTSSQVSVEVKGSNDEMAAIEGDLSEGDTVVVTYQVNDDSSSTESSTSGANMGSVMGGMSGGGSNMGGGGGAPSGGGMPGGN